MGDDLDFTILDLGDSNGFDVRPWAEALGQVMDAFPMLGAEDATDFTEVMTTALTLGVGDYDENSNGIDVAVRVVAAAAAETPVVTTVKALQLAGLMVITVMRVDYGDGPPVVTPGDAYRHAITICLRLAAGITAAQQRDRL